MALFSSSQPSLRARILPRFPAQVLAGAGIAITKSGGTYTFSTNTIGLQQTFNIPYVPGSTAATYMIPVSCTITRVTVLANASGNLVLDLLKGTYTDFPYAESICGAAKPTLAPASKYRDAILTGWNKNVVAGDVLRIVTDSVSGIDLVTVCLDVETT